MLSLKTAALAAVAASTEAAFTVVAPNLGTAAMGVSFYDANNGILPMNANGVGSVVLITKDGGNTWPIQTSLSALLVLDGVTSGSSALVSSPFGELYSLNHGASFNSSIGGGMSQGLSSLPNGGFAVAGQFGLSQLNGVGVSNTGGMLFTDYAATPLQTLARYVAAADTNTIYMTAGQWPNTNSNSAVRGSSSLRGSVEGKTYQFDVSKKVRLSHEPSTKHVAATFPAPVAAAASPAASQLPDTLYAAQIVKSTDGGATWSSVFFKENAFYFNGIACQDANNCCATAEADSDSPAGQGAYILCTNDGGSTWETKVTYGANGASLMDISTGSTPGEYYATGGVIDALSASGIWYHSTDSGATWTVDSTVSGYYGASIFCLPEPVNGKTACWSSVLTPFQTAGVARNF